MAIVTEDVLKQKLKEGILPVYILFGEDGYLKKSYTDKISRKIAPEDDLFNFSKFHGGCELQEVYDSVMQFPFMVDKKCVVLSDYDFEHCSKADLDKLITLIEEVPDTASLILVFHSVEIDSKKSSKFKSLVSAAEKNGGLAVKLDHKKMPELIKMLCDGAQKRGIRLEASVAKYLVETAGDDINVLRNELMKLCSFKKTGYIDKDDINNICAKTVEASVYNLSRFIFDKDVSGALSILDELFFMRVEPMIVLHTISSAYVEMYRIYTASKKGLNNSDVAKNFGYKGREFVLDRAKQNLRKMDEVKLRLSLETLTKSDKDLKTFGADSKIILEQLVVKLIYIIAKGESVDKA